MSGSQQPWPRVGDAGSSSHGPGGAPLDAPHRQRRLQALSRGMDLYLHIEDLAEEWLDQVCGPDLSRQEAVLALITGLRGGLEPPPGGPASRH